jgi:pimeloyl-ACP methyl ester carboxylesterase
MITRSLLLVLLAIHSVPGCAGRKRINPSFDVTNDQASAAIRDMRESPKELQRPLVILGGFSDPFGASLVRGRFEKFFEDEPKIIVVSFIGVTDFDQCRRRVIEAVDRAFPTDDPMQTREVDVIGLSMGGLVARIAAEPDDPEARRLRIARLFAIASPLRGAKLANFPLVLTPMHRDMRVGSALLDRLNANPPDYLIYPYTRLNDGTVGESLAAPAGQDPWWLDASPFSGPHFTSALDKRIIADIARRLRDEEPFATEPRSPLPDRDQASSR